MMTRLIQSTLLQLRSCGAKSSTMKKHGLLLVCVCVCVTCFAILWLALKGEGVSSMVAATLDAAAGLAQRQKWGLILPSSARVSLLTHQTVLGVDTQSWSRPLLMGGNMVGMSPPKPRCREDSYRSFGMAQKVPCTLSVILGH